MHYYQFNIGDYRKDTGHLSNLEHGIYRQLIDWYYLDESPIPLETQSVMRRLRLASESDTSALQSVLSDFFERQEDGFHHPRCDAEIEAYHKKSAKNRENGKKGGRPKASSGEVENQLGSSGIARGNRNESEENPNHKPITKNQEPSEHSSSEQSSDGGDRQEKPDPKPRKQHGTAEDHEAARWIFERVRLVDATAKEPNWDSWANEVRLMREQDGRTHREVCELFQWANRDQFWRSNILSPGKLREKWTQLSARRASPPDAPRVNPANGIHMTAEERNRQAREILGFGPKKPGDVIDVATGPQPVFAPNGIPYDPLFDPKPKEVGNA